SIAVAALRKAWTTGDRAAAGDDAPADVLNVLFSVPPKGWGSPHCKEGICRLRKTGVPGSMTWMVEGGSSGYFVGEVDVPPIPLAVAHLPKPVWGLYLAAGGSGYSQLAAATAQLQALGMSGQTIGNLPVSCQSSVAERLQVPAGFYTIVVFFRRKSEAQTFESGLHFPPIGLLKVTVRC
ncbi:MAG TPA: hypothetical protein VF972_04085, partial [Actinomycetota bacterium]